MGRFETMVSERVLLPHDPARRGCSGDFCWSKSDRLPPVPEAARRGPRTDESPARRERTSSPESPRRPEAQERAVDRDSPSPPLHDPRAIGGGPGVRAGIADLDRLDHGAFICDRGGQILAANTAARGLLEGQIDGDRRIRFARSGDDTAFAVLLKAALDTSRAGEAPVMACKLAVPALVVLRAMRLRRDVGPASDVLVLIEKQRVSPVDALRRDYGLTATEVRVAIALAEGNGVDEICASHGVGPATVRSHLKSIFRKTDTRGQVQLVVLVSGLRRSS